MKTISEILFWLGEYVPWLIFAAIWLAILPLRLIVLLAVPPGAVVGTHRLHKLRQFFAFESWT
jgi:hypothetical protein